MTGETRVATVRSPVRSSKWTLSGKKFSARFYWYDAGPDPDDPRPDLQKNMGVIPRAYVTWCLTAVMIPVGLV